MILFFSLFRLFTALTWANNAGSLVNSLLGFEICYPVTVNLLSF